MKRIGELIPAFQQKVREMTEQDLTHVDSPNDSTSRATGGMNEADPTVNHTEGATTMTHEELKQAALDCLVKAFRGEEVPAHVVHAAVSILMTPQPKP